MSTVEKRSPDSAEQRERIDVYLGRNGLSRLPPAHRPADRRRLRSALLPHPDGAWHAVRAGAARDGVRRATRCRSPTSRGCSSACRFRSRRSSGHADDIGVLALEDLGDVTLQAHLGAATSSEHAALYRQAVALIATIQNRGAELESPEYLPYRIAFDVEKLTWEMEFFIKHFIEAYRGVVISSNVRERAARGIQRADRGTGRGAAGPVPPRLSQPQPDVPPGPAVHHRLPGRAHGAGHLRSGVAAARLLRRSARTDRRTI